jgi:hypothetical protein
MRLPMVHRRCGSRGQRIHALAALPALSLVIAAAAAGAVTRPAAPEGAAQTFKLDHFLCYSVEPVGAFEPRLVTVADQIARRRVRLLRVDLLCSPVQKNNGAVRNRRAHLVCYRQQTQVVRRRSVVLMNQLGTFRGVTVTPLRLCLPSGKNIGATIPAPAAGLDHFACYAIRTTTQPKLRRFTLTDQFGRRVAAVGRNASLCVPARKNTSRILNRRDHLTCVTITTSGLEPVRVTYRNQFGPGRLVVVRPALLCLPTLKRIVTPPDLTVDVPAVRIPVDCPRGPGTCVTTVAFTISNPSATAVTTSFQVLVEADPGVSKTITVSGLAAGASQSFSELLGPAGNCYDPDCTVRVTVDSGNAVAESNESNNVDTHTTPG